MITLRILVPESSVTTRKRRIILLLDSRVVLQQLAGDLSDTSNFQYLIQGPIRYRYQSLLDREPQSNRRRRCPSFVT